MQKVRKYYDDNRLFIWGLVVIYFFQILYLINATTNIPMMDYWTYLNEFTDKVFSGNISVSDIWANFTSHRAPFQYLLFFINLKFFSGDTLVSVFAGSIVTLLTTLYISRCYTRNNEMQNVCGQLSVILIAAIMFSLNRWEIITLEFSMAFAVRIFLFIIIFNLIDKLCKDNVACQKYVFEIGALISVTIIFFSSSYFPAMVFAIASAMCIELLIKTREERKKFFKYCLILALFVLMAAAIYIFDLGTDVGSANIFSGSFWIDMVKALVIMMASSCVHVNILNNTSMIILGSIVLIVYIITTFIYFKKKIYKVTYIPLMLMLYSIGSMLMIYYGRAGVFDLNYLSSSRYTYETTLGLVGIVWINTLGIEKGFIKKKRNYFSLVMVVMVLISIIHVNKIEGGMAIYRKSYMQNLQEIASNIDEYTDDELSGFQANDPSYVRNGVELLKKYKLSLFKY